MMLLTRLAHHLNQLAQQLLPILLGSKRHGRAQLAGHLGHSQDDELRVDLARVQQPEHRLTDRLRCDSHLLLKVWLFGRLARAHSFHRPYTMPLDGADADGRIT